LALKIATPMKHNSLCALAHRPALTARRFFDSCVTSALFALAPATYVGQQDRLRIQMIRTRSARNPWLTYCNEPSRVPEGTTESSSHASKMQLSFHCHRSTFIRSQCPSARFAASPKPASRSGARDQPLIRTCPLIRH
jgi:hypothetical protein